MSKAEILLQLDEYSYGIHQEIQERILHHLEERVKMELVDIYLAGTYHINYTGTFELIYSLYNRSKNFPIPYEKFCEDMKIVVNELLENYYGLEASEWKGTVVMVSPA